MNRAERRKYEKRISKDKNARMCPKCGRKSFFIAVPTDEKYICDVKCELCKETAFSHVEGLIPYTYCVPPQKEAEK